MLTANFSYSLMPVVDYPAIAQLVSQLKQLQEQYKVIKGQYDTAKEHYTTAQNHLQNAKSQLNTINKIKDFNSGHYGMGELQNTLTDLKGRQWSPNNWDDALKNLSGGNTQRYQQLVKSYNERMKHNLSAEDFSKVAGKGQAEAYKQSREVNQAVVVQTTYAFNDINEHLKSVHELSAKIDKTENTKSAIDLNSRLVAEIAYIQLQTLKLQTLISQQTSQVGANQIAKRSDMASFNRLPDM